MALPGNPRIPEPVKRVLSLHAGADTFTQVAVLRVYRNAPHILDRDLVAALQAAYVQDAAKLAADLRQPEGGETGR